MLRNLSAGEIAEQAAHALARSRLPLSMLRNVVFMGMGEPLNNYKAVIAAIGVLTSAPRRGGFGLARSHVTVSTVGVIPRMRTLAADAPGVRLALSLHAPSQSEREALVPSATTFQLPALLEAAAAHAAAPGGSAPLIEYVLLRGVNDSLQHAAALGALLANRPGWAVNLIPFNRVAGAPYDAPAAADVVAFQAALRTNHGINATVRRAMGQASAHIYGGNTQPRSLTRARVRFRTIRTLRGRAGSLRWQMAAQKGRCQPQGTLRTCLRALRSWHASVQRHSSASVTRRSSRQHSFSLFSARMGGMAASRAACRGVAPAVRCAAMRRAAGPRAAPPGRAHVSARRRASLRPPRAAPDSRPSTLDSLDAVLGAPAAPPPAPPAPPAAAPPAPAAFRASSSPPTSPPAGGGAPAGDMWAPFPVPWDWPVLLGAVAGVQGLYFLAATLAPLLVLSVDADAVLSAFPELRDGGAGASGAALSAFLNAPERFWRVLLAAELLQTAAGAALLVQLLAPYAPFPPGVLALRLRPGDADDATSQSSAAKAQAAADAKRSAVAAAFGAQALPRAAPPQQPPAVDAGPGWATTAAGGAVVAVVAVAGLTTLSLLLGLRGDEARPARDACHVTRGHLTPRICRALQAQAS